MQCDCNCSYRLLQLFTNIWVIICEISIMKLQFQPQHQLIPRRPLMLGTNLRSRTGRAEIAITRVESDLRVRKLKNPTLRLRLLTSPMAAPNRLSDPLSKSSIFWQPLSHLSYHFYSAIWVIKVRKKIRIFFKKMYLKIEFGYFLWYSCSTRLYESTNMYWCDSKVQNLTEHDSKAKKHNCFI